MKRNDDLKTVETKGGLYDESDHYRFFDNPFTRKILTKEEVAIFLRKSVTWVARMAACGALPHHYVGDTAMFHLDEVVNAFLSDSLARRRKPYEYQKSDKQRRQPEIRSEGDDPGETTLQTLRQAARSRGLD